MSPEENEVMDAEEANAELEERKMFEQNAERIEKYIQEIMKAQGIGRGKAKKALIKMHKQQMKILNKRIQKNAHLPKQHVEEVVDKLSKPIEFQAPEVKHVGVIYPNK